MSTPIVLIDGQDLIDLMITQGLQDGGLGDFNRKMMDQLSIYRTRTGGYRIWVVFEGKRFKKKQEDQKYLNSAGVRIFFTKPSVDVKAFMLRTCGENPGNVMLVTSRNSIKQFAKKCSIRHLGTSQFLVDCLATGKLVEDI